MDKEVIHELLKNKIKKIARLSDAILPDFDHDGIHKLRVEVKKLRAFLRLIDTDKSEPEIKIPKKFKRLYHIVGAIRDAQLEQKKIDGWKVNLPLYTGNLNLNISRQKEEWKKHYSKKVIARLKEKIDNHTITNLKPEVLKIFFDERIENIEAFSRKRSHSNNQIHAVRKQVKDMLYVAKFAEKKWIKGYEKIAGFSVAELDKLSAVIGDYNDGRIMLEHLTSFSSTAMTDDEKNAITNTCDEEMDRLLVEKKKVLAKVKKFAISSAK